MVQEEVTGNPDAIYVDPEDPKKKRLDELKQKAKLVAAKRPRRQKVKPDGEIVSDTASCISDTVSESGFSVSSKASIPMSVGSVSSASTTMPFLTYTR